MTTLEYMEKQLNKHRANYARESARGVSQQILDNIKAKIHYYDEAIRALKAVGSN